jgi:tubulin--tyrosine ligase
MSIPFRPKPRKSTIVKPIFYAVVNYPDQYVQPLICKALNALERLPYEIVSSTTEVRDKNAPLLQYATYESLDFEHAMTYPQTSLISAYVIRKALIRKHYLSNTISTWLVKHPESVLKKSFRACEHFELDYAEFLDDALVEAWDLKASMARNMEQKDPSRKEWWILKPGMSDRGNGIRLFSSLEDLQEVFEGWDDDSDFMPDSDEDNEEEEYDDDDGQDTDATTESGVDQEANSPVESLDEDEDEDEDEVGAMTSQLRHFIVQPYIDRPMLLASMDKRKYHIRAYVLAVGALRVYVYREMLALFAARPYSPPWDVEDINAGGLASQLTNTCFQDESKRESSVRRFWALQDEALPPKWQEKVFSQICDVTGEVFEAASREQMVHFQTLPNAFEVFGVDFLVDEQFNVWLLELNAYPDFKQTGQGLQDKVVGGLMQEVARVAIAPFFDRSGRSSGSDRMVLVRSIELGRG